MVELILKDETWVAVASSLGLLAILAMILRQRRHQQSKWTIVVGALNLFFGLWIGIMGLGHLVAVTIKAVQGTLPANVHLWIAIPLGFALAVPGWWLTALIRGLLAGDKRSRRRAMWLNAWLATATAAAGAGPVPVFPLTNLLVTWKAGTTPPGSPTATKQEPHV